MGISLTRPWRPSSKRSSTKSVGQLVRCWRRPWISMTFRMRCWPWQLARYVESLLLSLRCLTSFCGKLQNGIHEYLTGKRALIYFNRLPQVRTTGDVPYPQSRGYLEFYETVLNTLNILKERYPIGYAHIRTTTRRWVCEARCVHLNRVKHPSLLTTQRAGAVKERRKVVNRLKGC